MDYVSFVGDAIYFGEEGNHRTCIASFFFHAEGLTTIHGVRLGNYMIDWTFKDLFDKISFYIGTRGLPVYLFLQNRMVERNEAANWKMDRYRIVAMVRKSRKEYELDFADLQEFYYTLQQEQEQRRRKPWWMEPALLAEINTNWTRHHPNHNQRSM